MAFVIADRVAETTTTTGTGTLNLAGPVTGFQSFVSGVGDTNTTYYVMTDNTDWEVGIGTVSAGSPDTLSRDTILQSTNSDAAVNWGAGTKDVFLSVPAGHFVANNLDNTFTGNNTFTGDNTFAGDNIFTGGLTKSNDTFITGRNAANDADIDIIKVNAGDDIEIGGNMSGASTHKLINMADPTSAQDYATKAYVDGNSASLTLGTSVATTSGTSIDFTSIPSGVKIVIISFSGVRLNSTDDILIQLGDSGGVETTGYQSTSTLTSTGVNTISSTSGIVLNTAGATGFTFHGSIILSLLDATTNTWCANASLGREGGASACFGGGSKSLSGELTTIRLTSSAGTNTYNGGIANILWGK
jgi:hypothetical protein